MLINPISRWVTCAFGSVVRSCINHERICPVETIRNTPASVGTWQSNQLRLTRSPSRMRAEVCLSIGAILTCCGLVVALIQPESAQSPLIAAGTDPVVAARDGQGHNSGQQDESSAIAKALERELRNEVDHYRPPRQSIVSIHWPRLTHQGPRVIRHVYHWRQNCPVLAVYSASRHHRYLHLTRAQAEALKSRACAICLELEANAREAGINKESDVIKESKTGFNGR